MRGRRSDGAPFDDDERQQVLRTSRRLSSAIEELAQAVRETRRPRGSSDSNEVAELALRSAREISPAANAVLQLEVMLARRGGRTVSPLSWSDISEYLGAGSKQRVQQRFKDVASTLDVSTVVADMRKRSDHMQALATQLHEAVRPKGPPQGGSQATSEPAHSALRAAAHEVAGAIKALARELRHSAEARVTTYLSETRLALQAAHQLSRVGEDLLSLEVLLARRGSAQLSWQAVADALGESSKQAVHYRYHRAERRLDVTSLTGEVRASAARIAKLAEDLGRAIRTGRGQHREDLRRASERRASARRSSGLSPLEPEPYDPDVAAWVRELSDRGLLARPDKAGPPEDNESPADYFGRAADYEPSTAQLASVKGWIGYRRATDSFYGDVVEEDESGRAKRIVSVGEGGFGRRYEFDEVAEALPMVDWASEYEAVRWLAVYAGLRVEDLAALLPWDDRLRSWPE